MTPSKIAANRQNAKLSTGPKSAQGKKASAQNARSHGLSRPTAPDGEVASSILALAQALSAGKPEWLPGAIVVAEWQVRLESVRATVARKLELATAALGEGEYGQSPIEVREDVALASLASELLKLDDYERRAGSKLRKAIRALGSM